MPELVLPKPLAHQVGPLQDEARFKVWRWGRRSGKSRGGFIAGVAGHGRGASYDRHHAPLYRGALQGGEVIWVARDYPQSLTIWQEEVRPRFAGIAKVEINEQRRQVMLPNGGMLEVRSAEAIDGIRGRGKNLAGLILDEAAHWDLEYAWRNVLLPALLDNNGWAILNSSPNAGPDGNAAKLTPSFFNRLCEQIMAGDRGPAWSHSHLTAAENPAISPDSLAELVAEYPAESAQLAQEVYAKLITGGAGLAFAEWNAKYHTTTSEVPSSWRWFAGMDWGYSSPGAFLLLAAGPDKDVVARAEHYFKQRTPFDVGESVGHLLQRYGTPDYIAADSAMWAVTDGGEAVWEGVQRGLASVLGNGAPAMLAAAKGPGSRVAGKMLVHQVLAFDPSKIQEDGTLALYHLPRLRVHATGCPNLLRTLPRLPVDERNPEDVDTDAEDHAYDALRYALIMRQPDVQRPKPEVYSQHRSPGFHVDGTKRKPHIPGWDERYERELADELRRSKGDYVGSGMAYRFDDAAGFEDAS